MRRIVIGLAMLASLALGCTQAVRTVRLETPLAATALPTKVDIAAYQAKYAGYDGVILKSTHTIEHSGIKEGTAKRNLGILGALAGSPWQFSRVYEQEYVVLNPEAQELTTWSRQYVPDNIYFKISYPDGTVKVMGKADLIETPSSRGNNVYKIAFPNVTIGTVIAIGWEFEYGVGRYPPPLEYDIDLQFSMPCEQVNFMLGYPDWWTIAIKKAGPNRPVPVLTTADLAKHKLFVKYAAADVPAVHYEPFSPPWKWLAQSLTLQIMILQMGEEMSLTMPATWGKYGENFYMHTIKKMDKKSDLLMQVCDSLSLGSPSKVDRLDRVMRYLWKNIRVDGSVDNKGEASKILASKAGNIYEVTALAQSMLGRLDILSSFLLVHNAQDGWFDPEYISSEQMYVPALQVKIDSQSYMLFPGFAYLPVNVIPEEFQGQFALTIAEGGSSSFTTPVLPGVDNVMTSTQTVTIDSSGLLSVVDLTEMGGTYGYGLRRDLRGLSEKARADTLRQMVTLAGVDQQFQSARMLNDTLYKEPLKLEYKYTLANVVTTTPNEMIIQVGDLLSSIGDTRVSEDTAQRRNPVYISFEHLVDRTITFALPDGWIPAAVPEPVKVENDFGSLEVNWSADGGKLVVHQMLLMRRTEQPREKYGDLLALVGRNSQAPVPAIVLTRAKS